MAERQLVVRCQCGWETTGSEEEVVETTQAHGEAVHNMKATRSEVLAMSRPAEAGG